MTTAIIEMLILELVRDFLGFTLWLDSAKLNDVECGISLQASCAHTWSKALRKW